MDITRAKEILELLADGVNPLTGEVLSANDSCNQVEVVRALHAVLKHMSSIPKAHPAENAGKPWSPEDEETLCKMYDSRCTIKEMCNRFGRTKGSITARLVHLGKITKRMDV